MNHIKEFIREVVNEMATNKIIVMDNDVTLSNDEIVTKTTVKLKKVNCEVITVEHIHGYKKWMYIEKIWDNYFALNVTFSVTGEKMDIILEKIKRIKWTDSVLEYIKNQKTEDK